MLNNLANQRLITMGLFMVALSLALIGRLFLIQVLRHEELSAKADSNVKRAYLNQPRRGEIRDIRGNPLATSIFVKTLCADPVFIGSYSNVLARVMAPVIGKKPEELAADFQITTRTNESTGRVITNRYVVVQRKVRPEKWLEIKRILTDVDLVPDAETLTPEERKFLRNLRRKALFVDSTEDQLRIYPNETLASHVVGHVGNHYRERNGFPVVETVGLDGIEATLDSKLAGIAGWRMTETDPRGRELVAFRDQNVAARPGLNVVLTLDAGVQHIMESAMAEAWEKHRPKSITSIVVRPRTGEILGMATLPNYNPADPAASEEKADWRNRAISDISEPGSTFKIVVVSAALNEGITTLSRTYDCEMGRFLYAGRYLKDHDPYGILTVEEIIAKSSNIGSAKIGIQLGEERLYNYVQAFGFGQRTGIPLLGEVRGITHPVDRWSKLSISRIPMGHEIASTPLQMVMAMCAIANEGTLMRPMLVDRLEDAEGRTVARYAPHQVRQAVSPKAAKAMVQALKSVVSEKGTGKTAILEHYTVAGKTGTAQKPINGRYVPGKYFSSFIGFFPADRPEICISVVLDEPERSSGYYGGSTAGPVFARIARQLGNYLNIPPDIAPPTEFTSNRNGVQVVAGIR